VPFGRPTERIKYANPAPIVPGIGLGAGVRSRQCRLVVPATSDPLAASLGEPSFRSPSYEVGSRIA